MNYFIFLLLLSSCMLKDSVVLHEAEVIAEEVGEGILYKETGIDLNTIISAPKK